MAPDHCSHQVFHPLSWVVFQETLRKRCFCFTEIFDTGRHCCFYFFLTLKKEKKSVVDVDNERRDFEYYSSFVSTLTFGTPFNIRKMSLYSKYLIIYVWQKINIFMTFLVIWYRFYLPDKSKQNFYTKQLSNEVENSYPSCWHWWQQILDMSMGKDGGVSFQMLLKAE